MIQLLEFTVDGHRCALPLEVVERVYLAVEVTPLAHAPEAVQGLVNVSGRVMPVVSLRRRMGLLDREILPSDRLIVAHTPQRAVALLVDAVPGVLDVGEGEYVSGEALFPGTDFLLGVSRRDGDLLMVEDLEKLFGTEAHSTLDAALGERDHATLCTG